MRSLLCSLLLLWTVSLVAAAEPLCRIQFPAWLPAGDPRPSAGFHVYRRDPAKATFAWVATGSAEHDGITVPCAQEGSTWWVQAFRVWTEPPRLLTEQQVVEQFRDTLSPQRQE